MHGSGAGLLSLLLLICTSFLRLQSSLSPLTRRTMASTMEFDPAYIQNIQAQYAQTFDAAIKLGLGAIGLEVGSKVIYFVYDKARKASTKLHL